MLSEVRQKAMLAQDAAAIMNRMTTQEKNDALIAMADALIARQEELIAANAEDLLRGESQGTSPSLLDRLALNSERIAGIADGLRQIVDLPDPVGGLLESFERPNGMKVEKIRVPLGVIGMIYEARPNVTVDAAGLCLKTSNTVVLRGGSAAISSNRKIVEILKDALTSTKLPSDAIQLIEDSDRASVGEMLKLNGLLDVVIPRGGAALIRNVIENATVPVIETGAGICHVYIDDSAELEMAISIAFNGKVQRPSVCNSIETLLIHEAVAKTSIQKIAQSFIDANVELRGCERTLSLLPGIKLASDDDYSTEYNDYILNVKIVDNIDEALHHIRKHGTKHSECIVTETEENASKFLQEVDAAAVYHNVSTRFTDGFEFGFGAEIGISTQKLHARGPMGLPALTSTKYRIFGTGQIRN
ncbi:glutamate-5-semialdehyde dehydrogenase [Paenibacillus sp. L3-i20]|uniref:glutamate-5-semialdehyde dehydrogenase n=1 Tax=Paenibacillus sp. L3-i20 TaxID=2905833 RepID=UPI001EE07678|nr:glutamate-5-semialdehyde dehydrogenase [Paenibacillus sp. L3-i20]GKU79489.1 gamma-glutamyl phosphate reductase [Paenibacillus sp. L3-i20]